MMKRIYRTILAILGFGAVSCSLFMKKMYGSPYVELDIKGTVTDQKGNPIPGILVTIPEFSPEQKTDASGKVELSTTLGGTIQLQEFNIVFKDIDGPQNGGTFATDTLYNKDMEIKKVSDGHGDWHEGSYEVVFEKKLRPREDRE